MMPGHQVAIITGGASGIGLALAESLSGRDDWAVHVFDLSTDKGEASDDLVSTAKFHKVDVNSWDSLSLAFNDVFQAEKRLDFVFANAGVMEKGDFYKRHDTNSPPPPPDESTIDINLKGVVRTAYLAQHYFRANTEDDAKRVLVMTSSVAGIYPQAITPLYAATKAGIINFMRSVAGPFYKSDGIRTYAICPGSVRTNLLSREQWDAYPATYLTPMTGITATVWNLIRGDEMNDSNGQVVDLKSDHGLAIEIFAGDIYFREPPSPCNRGMRFVIEWMSKSEN